MRLASSMILALACCGACGSVQGPIPAAMPMLTLAPTPTLPAVPIPIRSAAPISTATPTPALTPIPTATAPALSARLPSGWYDPLPGGVVGGYPADTGLDIAGLELPVHAIAAGTLIYSESGHTRWAGPRDDDNAVLVELERPMSVHARGAGCPRGDCRVTHVWYAHLSRLERIVPDRRDPDNAAAPAIHVAAGERLGVSGRANGHPHLHLGLLLDGETRQWEGTFLYDSEIRTLMGLRLGQRLPR